MSHLTLFLPQVPELVAIGNRIARIFEPDSGIPPLEIYNVFGNLIVVDAEGNEFGCYGAPVTEEVYNFAPLWKDNASLLRVAIKAYNDMRFPDEADPALSTVEKFVDAVLISQAPDTASAIAEMNMTIKVEELEVLA